MAESYIKIKGTAEGKYSDFYIYLPGGEGVFTEYRFVYVNNPVKAELEYSGGPNDQANCEFYRIREAYVGSLDNKIYFYIAKDTVPKKGTVWQSNVYYRLTYLQ